MSSPSSQLRVQDALAGVTEQVEEILAAAESAAAETRAQAEAEGRALLERRSREAEEAAAVREAGAADVLDQSAAAVHQARGAVAGLSEQLDRIAAELEETSGRLDECLRLLEASRDEAAPAPSEAPEEDREEQPREEQPPEADATGGDREASLGRPPLVRAVQMAMAGSSREEIDEVLREEFGVADPAPILDEALGRK